MCCLNYLCADPTSGLLQLVGSVCGHIASQWHLGAVGHGRGCGHYGCVWGCCSLGLVQLYGL